MINYDPYKTSFSNCFFLQIFFKVPNNRIIDNMIIYSPQMKHSMFIEYINSLMIHEKDTFKIWKVGDNIEINDDHEIVIFMQIIPNMSNDIIFKNTKRINIFLCNTEQMSRYYDALVYHVSPFYDMLKNTNRNIGFGIIDYSDENIKILREQKYIIDNNIDFYYIPYQYRQKEVDFLKSLKTDERKVCTCGSLSDRRKTVITELLNDQCIKIDNIIGFGDQRDVNMMKYKILLNISLRDDHNIYEHIRCDRLIFAGTIIISEHKLDEQLLDVYDMIVWCDKSEFSDKICDVLHNYDEYKNKITDEKIQKIAETRRLMYMNFRNKYVEC